MPKLSQKENVKRRKTNSKRKKPPRISAGPTTKEIRSTSIKNLSQDDFPLNKDGYLYTLANPDKIAIGIDFKVKNIMDAIPAKYYRQCTYDCVCLNYSDRAEKIIIEANNIVKSQNFGYSMIRGSHGINDGRYFFELKILNMSSEAALRVGWSQKYGPLQAPVGYDEFSYSWRSLYGTKFHQSQGTSYSSYGYSIGDVIGVYIDIPMNNIKLNSSKNDTLVKFKENFFFEERFDINKIKKDLDKVKASQIGFYKNGVYQGVAFEDIYGGTYFPAISIFHEAAVQVNFGPIFEYPVTHAKPVSERCESEFTEKYLGDLYYLTVDF